MTDPESKGQFDTEPAWAALLERRSRARALPAYEMSSLDSVKDAVGQLIAEHEQDSHVLSLARLAGGASKEQFSCVIKRNAVGGASTVGRYVLRTDPPCPIIETDCSREFALLRAIGDAVPVAQPVWLDATGQFFGRPAMVSEFIAGVTKPSRGLHRVSGMGTYLGEPLRSQLKGQFLDILVKIHGFDWRTASLCGFVAPQADPRQAARWSLTFWDAIWMMDKLEERPVVSLVRCWLRDNIPDCNELVLNHGDYRTGNYLFDEDRGEITVILDWELARIGDFHEDLGWILLRLFSCEDGGVLRASDLYEKEEFIEAYEAASGRSVNRRTLKFYEVLAVWKCYMIVAASGLSAARRQQSHQDVLLTFMGASGAMFAHELAELMEVETM